MAELLVQDKSGSKQRFTLDQDRVTVGRSRENQIFIPDQWLSRHHAEIRKKGAGFVVVDLGSKNGTQLNGARLVGEAPLLPGDIVTLGEHVLTFSTGEAPEDKDDADIYGTQIYSARELSDVGTKPVDAEGLARQNRVLSVLTKATRELLVHRPLAELFDLVLDLLLEAVPAERAVILIVEGGQPQIKASRSRSGQPITRVSRSITRRVLSERVSLLIPNIFEDATLRAQDSIMASGIRSALCAPLWYTATSGSDEDSVIGLVYLDTLARQNFSEEDLRILTAIANVAASKIENVRLIEHSMEMRRMEQDIQVAAEIQRGFLPACAPKIDGYGLVGSNMPCHTVGGDYYDFMVEKGELFFALGDVSGKGTGAALLMTVLRAAVRGHWIETIPSEAIVKINRTVCQNVPSNKYITFFMGRIDIATGRLAYVNAGHNAPILARAQGGVERLTEGGMVLGLFEGVPFAEGATTLERGDTLVVFSDGVSETFTADDQEFGEDRLAELVTKKRGLTASKLEIEILRELETFAKGAKATDDRTLIVLQRATS